MESHAYPYNFQITEEVHSTLVDVYSFDGYKWESQAKMLVTPESRFATSLRSAAHQDVKLEVTKSSDADVRVAVDMHGFNATA